MIWASLMTINPLCTMIDWRLLKNGKPTIVAIGNENMKFRSPDFKLSTRDAVEINALYDCHKSKY